MNKFRQEHKKEILEKRYEYDKKRKKEDPTYRFKISVRACIRRALNTRAGYRKRQHTEQILGCTVDEFITYLQSKFQEGMTLENHRRMAYRSHNTYI